MLESILDTAIENLSFEKGCVKFGFSERATKFEKNLHRIFDKSVMFFARSSLLIKNSTKIFENKCGQVVSCKL